MKNPYAIMTKDGWKPIVCKSIELVDGRMPDFNYAYPSDKTNKHYWLDWPIPQSKGSTHNK